AKRREIVYDIQRYLAEQVYYAYDPSILTVAAWEPYVKNFAPNIGHDYGGRPPGALVDQQPGGHEGPHPPRPRPRPPLQNSRPSPGLLLHASKLNGIARHPAAGHLVSLHAELSAAASPVQTVRELVAADRPFDVRRGEARNPGGPRHLRPVLLKCVVDVVGGT